VRVIGGLSRESVTWMHQQRLFQGYIVNCFGDWKLTRTEGPLFPAAALVAILIEEESSINQGTQNL
jgi:hypothetical protein